jgi:phytoene desaturase
MMTKRVAVIGGGLGGLSGAIYLARWGFQVDLYEQNKRLGGKMGEWQSGGFRFDTGPSLLTMPFVIKDLFESTPLDLNDTLQLVPIDPVCRTFFSDSSSLDTFVDKHKMRKAMNEFSPQNTEQFDKFLNYSKRIYDITNDLFVTHPVHELSTLSKVKTWTSMLRFWQIDPFRTVHQSTNRFFNDKRLVQLFDRYATYNGSNPFKAPATLNIIPYVEFGLGSYYIKDGMMKLVYALEKLANHLGVNIHLNSRVECIEHDNRSVQGIKINNEFIPYHNVLCNADVVDTFRHLIKNFAKQTRQYEKLEPSLSGLVFLWGIDRSFPQLAHHNIFFSDDYELEFRQLFDSKTAPMDPTVYLSITSKTDPNHAPERNENWFVLANMPYLTKDQDWNQLIAQTKITILRKLEGFGLNIHKHIVTEKQISPPDFQALYGSNKGSIYGISSNSPSMAFRRPANRFRGLKGLYFAGGSAHPGGGIPLTLLSGKMAAALLHKYTP